LEFETTSKSELEFETAVIRIFIIVILSYWGGRTIRSHQAQQFPLQRPQRLGELQVCEFYR
jgi:hypothetical protein